ncbi:MAG TPA: hypothetical protein VLA33_02350 [Gemmatimonadota bacterium]|nr:hypothetical protein [Gemmatimonadota bacterium]
MSRFRRAGSRERLEEDLAQLEETAETTGSLVFKAMKLKQAGERAAEAGDEQRAKDFLGRAVDAYLGTGYYDSAAAICRRLIELYPDVVRARGTLAFLALAEGLEHSQFDGLADDARREIGLYVKAAKSKDNDEYAAERLRIMAEATDQEAIRELIGEYLMELGDTAGADAVLGAMFAERNDLSEEPELDQRARWSRALRVTIVSEGAPADGGEEMTGSAVDA